MEPDFSYFFAGKGLSVIREHMASDIREKYDLKQVDITLMFYLMSHKDKNTAKDIQDETHVSKGHISQSVERLRSKGLLEEVRDEKDHRRVHLTLTPQANSILHLLKRRWKDLQGDILEGIDPEDQQVALKVVMQIQKNILHIAHGFAKEEKETHPEKSWE